MQTLVDTSTTLVAFVMLLGIVIFVHEAGHMMVAKAFGVRVLTFSLGFGKRLWGFRRGETDYRVSLVPLGGYVKMAGELPGEESEDPADFLNKPRWQRFLVYLAGPAMNAVLSIMVIALAFMVGISVPAAQDAPAEVGFVIDGSSAATAGLLPGDRIVAVDGETVETWDRVQVLLMTAAGRSLELSVARGDSNFSATVTPQPIPDFHLSDSAGLWPKELLTVTQVQNGGVADEAGLEIGDQLRALDGRPILSWPEFVEEIQKRPGQETAIDILRDSQSLTLNLVPEDVEGTGRIGLMAGVFTRYSPGRAIVESVRHNIQIIDQTVFVLGKIFTRRISAESALSGPIEIAQIAGSAARRGLRYWVYMVGLISISIGFLNLLPIPVLDGGQMVLLTIEGVARRDLPMRVKDWINQVGFVLIVLLMLAVIVFDFKKLL